MNRFAPMDKHWITTKRKAETLRPGVSLYGYRDWLIKLSAMPRTLTADDIIPLVASLPNAERIKLLKWIALPHGTDDFTYIAASPARDEFSGDEEAITWDADGWDEFR